MLLHKIVFSHKQTLLQKQFFVDPHEGARVVGFTLVLDAAEAVAPLAVVSLVVVVELDLPDGLEKPCLSELYVDLNRLPLAAFGVCYSLCVIHPSVHYGLRVFRLLLQRKSHSADSHGCRRNRSRFNDHIDLIFSSRQ